MHLDSVDGKLLRLLDRFMKWPALTSFVLVGGTSLTLRTGYRTSTDLDLFSGPPFDSGLIRQELEDSFQDVVINATSRVGVFALVEGVKVDLVRHDQTWLAPHDLFDGFRLASLADISAMKINAVMGRGSKKDFSDLLYLHENGFPLGVSLENFLRKYGDDQLFAAVRSLNYFADTAGEPDPLYQNGWSWPQVEAHMRELSSSLSKRLTAQR